MKRFIMVLLVLLLAAPAMAEVRITAADEGNGDGWVAITYDADTGEGKRPRAFGLNIAVSDGNIADYNVVGAQPFRIYMGNIDINDVTGDIDNFGSPVAPNTAPDDPCQLGSSPIVIEMGSIYDPCIPSNPNQPGYSGLLIKVQASEDCNITLSANAARADTGVILEDGSSADVNFVAATNIPVSFGCYTGPDVTEWNNLGQPASWCNPRQCHGDADGLADDLGFGQIAYVGPGDLARVVLSYRKFLGDPCEMLSCDFDHDVYDMGFGQFTRCGPNDITILATYYRMIEGGGNEAPTDCLTADPCDP
jgi:hypothetical protein